PPVASHCAKRLRAAAMAHSLGRRESTVPYCKYCRNGARRSQVLAWAQKIEQQKSFSNLIPSEVFCYGFLAAVSYLQQLFRSNRVNKFLTCCSVSVVRGSVMKQSIVAAATAVVLAGGSALAADLPVKAPYYKAPVGYYGWSGAYFGVHAGWLRSDNSVT